MISLSDVTSVVNQLLPEPHAGLLNGILFGTKAQLTPAFKDALIRSGTLHIVALSGMNITILMNLTASTLLRVFSRKTTSLLTLLIIMGFVWFVGMSPSVIRAAIMGALALLSTVFGRQKGALWSLILAGAVMLIVNKSYLQDVSFQLSFLATLGIILFASKNIFKIRRPGKPNSLLPVHVLPVTTAVHSPVIKLVKFVWNLIADDLRTTLAAQVFTLPILIFTFHRVSLLSPVANILIGWIIQPLTVLGLFICVLGLVRLSLALPVAWLSWLLLQYMVTVITGISSVPFASIQW